MMLFFEAKMVWLIWTRPVSYQKIGTYIHDLMLSINVLVIPPVSVPRATTTVRRVYQVEVQ